MGRPNTRPIKNFIKTRIENNACVRCNLVMDKSGTCCKSCTAEAKQRMEQLKSTRISNGLCYKCGINPSDKICQPCKDKMHKKYLASKEKLSDSDLPKIEEEMKSIIKANLPFEKSELPIAKALAREKKSGQVYKLELAQDLKKQPSVAKATAGRPDPAV